MIITIPQPVRSRFPAMRREHFAGLRKGLISNGGSGGYTGTMFRTSRRLPAQSVRRGVTRAEVVVLALIVCLLAALVVPVIVTSRDQARRRASMDRQRFLYTRVMTYYDTYQSFPTMGRPAPKKK